MIILCDKEYAITVVTYQSFYLYVISNTSMIQALLSFPVVQQDFSINVFSLTFRAVIAFKMSSDNPETPTSNVGTHNYNNSSTLTVAHSCGNNNKLNSCNELQNKNRICRDFVRGSCRRLYCKVC